MPSPDDPSSSTLPAANNNINAAPESNHTLNGSAQSDDGSDGTANSNGESTQANGATIDAKDSILEGKQKAKAVMAASGINIASSEARESALRQSSSSPHLRGGSNDGQPSRKRSRSGSRIPSDTQNEDTSKRKRPTTYQLHLDQYVTRDQLHTAACNEQDSLRHEFWNDLREEKERYNAWRREGAHNLSMIYGRGYAGYGNGTTEGRFTIVYPGQKKRPGNRKAKELHVARKDRTTQADQVEELVPIRLDLEFEKLRLRDTFTWNLHDRVVTPELFAETLVEDFKVPPESVQQFTHQVYTLLQEQIGDFHPHIFIPDAPLDPSLPYSAYKNDEMRVIIRLNITIGQFTLVDQFEWDMNNPNNSPEIFARQMSADMSLPGEFTTAIAHSIHEQTQAFTKGLYISGHPFDGRPVEDSDIREGLQPSPLPSVFRTFQAAKEYSPLLYELNETDLERTEHVLLREQRAQKRSVNRRGGPSMPDLKDRQRTVRTLVVSSVLPSAAETIEASGLLKITRTSGRGRRSGRTDRGEDSDLSESEESDVDSPGRFQSYMNQGTARTRGMRGAANAAQAALRATYGRSQTPEVSLHHHETRTSARRFVGYDGKEESVDAPTTLIVKLRVPKELLRRLKREDETSKQNQSVGSLGTPQASTPQPRSSMPPPTSTPTFPQNRSLPGQFQRPPSSDPNGQTHRPSETPTPASGQHGPLPPLPAYVANVLPGFHSRYPDDSFEAVMRWAPDQQRHVPKFRCNDCPGKTYTIEPDHPTSNFELHLKNRAHKEKVAARLEGSG